MATLMDAAKAGDLEQVKLLISETGDIKYALEWAANNGHLEVVKYLVLNGADIHARNNGAIEWAAYNGHLEIVKYLVLEGANIRTSYALDNAVIRGNIEVVKFLVPEGANIRPSIFNKYIKKDIVDFLVSKIVLKECDYFVGSDLYKLLDTKYKDHRLFGTIKKIIEQRQLSSQRLLNCCTYCDIIIDTIC